MSDKYFEFYIVHRPQTKCFLYVLNQPVSILIVSKFGHNNSIINISLYNIKCDTTDPADDLSFWKLYMTLRGSGGIFNFL